MALTLSRRLLIQSAAATALLPLAKVPALAAPTTIDVCTDGDTNISDWWINTLKPAFEKAHPEFSLNIVITRANGGNLTVAQRVVAAKKTSTDAKVDFFEEFDPRELPGAIEAGAFTKVDETVVPNWALLNPLGKAETPFAIPYRASQVLIAYDSAKVKETPKGWAEITAWIKANPGQFIYCRPDKGGSGSHFVMRAVHEANGRDPSLFKPENFDAEKAKKLFAPAWALLNDIQPFLYDKGAYPAGNNPTLQLFAGGAVSMISAWSDQALQGISQGVLPETTKLTQLQDLALSGGFAFSSIPATTVHKEGAAKLADFALSPEMQAKMIADFGAFPGIDWKNLPAELAEKYKAIIPTSMPFFPGGQWEAALVDGWYANVATHLTRS